MKTCNRPRKTQAGLGPACLLSSTAAALLLTLLPVQGQKIFFEDFEGLELGPNVDEGLAGTEVWTKGPPPGWVADDSGVPGAGTALDGVTEWAGWAFADKFWWSRVDSGIQRRDEFTLASGTVMVADPDEWDDQPHPGYGVSTEDRTAQGLWYDTFVTTSPINLAGVEANSMVVAFASSWRPEYDSNYRQTGLLDAIWDDGTPVRLLHWVSLNSVTPWEPGDSEPRYKDDNSTNDEIVLPLNNPAGAGNLKLKFGMIDAGNDWWWAVDNIAVGVPPFASGVSANGVSFTVSLLEALGKTVNRNSVSVELDGTPVAPVTVTAETGRVLVTYNQAPQIFTPGRSYVVTVRFTASDGRQIVDTVEFTAPSYTQVAATPTAVTAVLTETAWLSVNETAGVQFLLDGASVTPASTTRNATNQVTLRYSQAPNLFASGSSHTLAVTFQTASGVSVTDTVEFTAPVWTALPPALATATGTGAELGLLWRTHLLQTAPAGGRPGTIAGAEGQLRNEFGSSIHNAQDWHEPQGADGYFRITVVNFDQTPAPAGRFNANAAAPLNVADDYIPGTPASPVPDYVAAEARAFLDLPAGLYTMVVNSDDGFQVTAGTADEPTYLVLGKFDATRGAADTVFYFNVQQAGVYFFRLLWFEGTGGASAEWFTLNADGSAALVNGAQTGAIRAYRTRTVAEPEIPDEAGIASIVLSDGNVVIDYAGTLKSSDSVTGPFTAVPGATSPYQTEPVGAARFFRAD